MIKKIIVISIIAFLLLINISIFGIKSKNRFYSSMDDMYDLIFSDDTVIFPEYDLLLTDTMNNCYGEDSVFVRDFKSYENSIMNRKNSPLKLEENCELIEWNITIGGKGRDVAYALEKTIDDEYILIGETSSFDQGGGTDLWLVKFDMNGNEIWNKSYGGKRSDFGFGGQQINDEGYILIGGTRSYGQGDQDVWLIRTDVNGNELWNMTYGGEDMDHGISVQQTSDNGFILVGGTKSYGDGPNDYWIIKTNEIGELQWEKTYGTHGYDWGYDIQKTNDGSFIFTGGTDTSLEGEHILDIGLVKISEDGIIEWDKTYNKLKSGWYWDEGYGVESTSDGGYVIAGVAHAKGWSESGEGDAWIIKTDDNGNKEWDILIGGSKCDSFSTVKQTLDGGYIVSGWTYSYGAGDCDIWLAKFDSQGKELWDITLGGEEYEWSMFHTVQEALDNSYIVMGETKSFGPGGSDVFIVKVRNPSLEIIIDGGIGLSVLVKNIGNEDMNNLEWNFELDGLLFAGSSYSNGIIDLLPANSQSIILSKGFFFGFGPFYLRIDVDGVCKTMYFFMLGPLLLI
jgi:hypothetical protein